MPEKEQEKQAGIGAKIGYTIVVGAAVAFYYLWFLNWFLMVPIQNLPFPYK